MIELTLTKFENYNEGLMLLNNILQWLAMIVTTNKENEGIVIDGTLCVYDSIKPRVAALVMCEGLSEKRLNELLQNPPAEYKGKYIACIASEEPEVVSECKPDEAEEKKAEDEEVHAAAT